MFCTIGNSVDKAAMSNINSLTPTNLIEPRQTVQKTNTEIICRFFNIKKEYDYEEDLILDILDNTSIDWSKLSEKKRIPSIILNEFRCKFDWLKIIYNTTLTANFILTHKTFITNLFYDYKTINSITDNNFHKLKDIVILLNDYTVVCKLYNLACSKKYINLLTFIVSSFRIEDKDNTYIYDFIKNNEHKFVEVILKYTNIQIYYYLSGTQYYYRNKQGTDNSLSNTNIRDMLIKYRPKTQ